MPEMRSASLRVLVKQEDTISALSTRAGFAIVPQATVGVMKDLRRRNDTEPLMIQLGVGYNTWRKILTGIPIRSSIANRLVDRFERDK